ncbi:hypothetical protein ENBRE01_2679 [Enteropsectra breve]|nr:hypothetical protein ENBRE01_2190 [Enteropsectra breve]KAI5152241.1 hypothetical protein ENBRE01_2679 [Enteropsectra breve]
MQMEIMYDYLEKNNIQKDTEFEDCAIIPAISSHVIKYTLPVIALDACHTKGQYKGIKILATAITGEDKGFIIGYGIALSTNAENWLKFVTLFNEALNLNEIQNLALISDRVKGLQFAITSAVSNAAHSYCIAHIERNIYRDLENYARKLGLQLKRAASQNSTEK